MIAVGQTIGNYTITAKLGEGGMGVVYLAEHPVIGRKVAMKAIHPELLRNPEVVSRFETEAKSVNQIGNDHIVDIHDFGTTADGEFYFIMEFLQGDALVDRLKRSAPLDTARALAIAAQVADALGASHQHGIIHRDLKPENIFLITKGHVADFVKVLDFGLAKLTQGDEKATHKTRTGSVMGTPYYMAPEQCEGKANIDHRADIYSLGVILFEMVTGKVPFGGEGYGEIIVKHITAQIPSPRAINPLLPQSIEDIIMRALAKARENRFQTMEEFAAALLDPEGYAAFAPAMVVRTPPPYDTTLLGTPGALSNGRADSVVSGRVLFGNADPVMGAQSVPMPSTFRHAVGEVGEENADVTSLRRPRKTGLVFALVGAIAAAGLAAYYYTQRPLPEAPPSQAATIVPPAAPQKVKLSFRSDPSGAAVLRKDTNEQLGITPFTVELPSSQTAIDFLFRKDSFGEKVETFVPAESGQLAVALVASPSPGQQPSQPRPEANRDSKPTTGKPATAGRHKPTAGGGRKHGGHAMDEDGVLAPSF
ncbi:MAG TPA: serine/threonine-protein kinase [Polyangia bacterium]